MQRRFEVLGSVARGSLISKLDLVAEWIHFGIILPTIKLKVHTFWGL